MAKKNTGVDVEAPNEIDTIAVSVHIRKNSGEKVADTIHGEKGESVSDVLARVEEAVTKLLD